LPRVPAAATIAVARRDCGRAAPVAGVDRVDHVAHFRPKLRDVLIIISGDWLHGAAQS
jgi:hypothetical protein